MSDIAKAIKTRTFLAENSGVIVVNTQREIEGAANPKFALEKIKEETFNTKDGEGTREVISYITQPTRTSYVAILGEGNEAANAVNPQTGETVANVLGDKVGRGCSLPADTMQMGYDVRTSCLKARAVEIGPFCILDLIRKQAHRQMIQRLWDETPDIMKSQFARQLLREVIRLGKFKFSAAAGVPMSTDAPHFPAPPTGGPDIGMIRRIVDQVNPFGWQKNSDAPMVDGRRAFQMYMGSNAVEWAISTRKANLNMVTQTTRTVDDKTFGPTSFYEGIQFLSDDRPMRGVLVPNGAGAFEFVEIEPTEVVPADGEGFKEVPNPVYEQEYAVINGDRRRVFEVGFYLAKNALVRESMGALPSMPGGKTFTRKFDLMVNPMTETQLDKHGCNPDLFFFGYRILHAYAMKRRRYELAGAFLYIAPKPRYDVIDPWTSPDPAAAAQPTTVRELMATPANACEPCDRPGFPDREPVMPTCTDLFPANGAGLMAFRQTGYDVDESAGNLTLVIDRYGGNVGAASCVITIAEGTGTNPENFTTPAGFAGVGPWTKTLNWADGVDGPVTVVVPIVAAVGDDDGKKFTGTLGTAVGAALGTKTVATVTILDPDEAA